MRERKTFGLGVFVCIFNKDFSKIMLTRLNAAKRKRWGAEWSNVGGKIEFGEDSKQACIREANEETGLNINPKDLTLIDIKEAPNLLPHLHAIHFVYATTIRESSKIILNYESDSYGWFSFKKLPKGMFDSKKDILNWRNIAKSKLRKRHD